MKSAAIGLPSSISDSPRSREIPEKERKTLQRRALIIEGANHATYNVDFALNILPNHIRKLSATIKALEKTYNKPYMIAMTTGAVVLAIIGAAAIAHACVLGFPVTICIIGGVAGAIFLATSGICAYEAYKQKLVKNQIVATSDTRKECIELFKSLDLEKIASDLQKMKQLTERAGYSFQLITPTNSRYSGEEALEAIQDEHTKATHTAHLQEFTKIA